MNTFQRIGKLRAAARELAGQPVPGRTLGCACQMQRGGMKGYRRATLTGTVNFRGRGLAAAPQGVPALVPISDRSAVTAAVKALKSGALRVR